MPPSRQDFIHCTVSFLFWQVYNGDMYYKFTFGSFFVGLIVLIIGAVMTVYHQKLADNLASGISSYDRFKFWGLVVCGVGFGIMLCLHTIPLGWLAESLFGRR